MSDDPLLPPQDLEAEQSVLGAVLANPESLDDAREVVQPQDFYRSAHQQVFDSLCRLSDCGAPLDLITVGDELAERGRLQDVGGRAYLAQLLSEAPGSATNIRHHGRIVKQKAQARGLIVLGHQLQASAYAGQDVEGLMVEAEQVLSRLSGDGKPAGWQPLKTVLVRLLDKVQAMHDRGELVTGVTTGFQDLDVLTAGWQPSDLIVIAGRPSQGKTSLALTCGLAAAKAGVPVGFVSLEMSADQLAARLVALQAGVDVHALRTGRIPKDGWKRLADGSRILENLPFVIDDATIRTTAQLRTKARRLKAQQGLGLLIVDYLQLMEGDRGENRQQVVSDLSRGMKSLAKELAIPVIVLSQLNRDCEKREDKRPMLADLRESGAIEQDADVIGFIYREEFYNPKTDEKNIAELNFQKHRNGPRDMIRLGFYEHLAAFVPLETLNQEGRP